MRTVSQITHGPISGAKADWLNVMDYGAKGDGTTDDTTAIQAALTAATPGSVTSPTSPSNTVYLPAGIYVCGPITIPHRVNLRGSGIGSTRLLCKAATANNSYMVTNVSTATLIAVSDMTLMGNLGNQTHTVHGLMFNGSGSGSEYTDMRAQAHNLMVQDFTGDGVSGTGRGVCQVNDVQTWNNGGHGFTFGTDCILSNCDAGQNGKDGFYLSSNTQVTNSKAWYSGWWNNGTTYGVQTTNVTAGFGNGFHYDVSQSGGAASNIYAQDNARCGIYIGAASDRISIAGWTADSNNNGTGATTFANVQIDNSFVTTMTGGCSFDRSANTQHPAKALTISGGSSNCVVRMTTNGFTAANKVSISGQTVQNIVEVDCSSGSYGVAYAATVTPDLAQGSFVDIGALTGNITIAAPQASFNTGVPLTFDFTQDGTGGRTVTWNAVFQTTWQPNAAASSVSSITFQWDSNDALWVPIASFGTSSGAPTTPAPLTSFYLPVITTGVKAARFVSVGGFTITTMKGIVGSGSGVTYRITVNGTAQSTSSATGTTVVSTTYSKVLTAGDIVQLEVVNAGTAASDLTVTLGGTQT